MSLESSLGFVVCRVVERDQGRARKGMAIVEEQRATTHQTEPSTPYISWTSTPPASSAGTAESDRTAGDVPRARMSKCRLTLSKSGQSVDVCSTGMFLDLGGISAFGEEGRDGRIRA